MRILFLSQTSGLVGGTESYLRAIFDTYPSAHTFGLIHADTGLANELGILPSGSQVDSISVSRLGENKTTAWIRNWQPDVIVNNGLQKPRLMGQVVKLFPTLFFPHDYHSSCISGSKFTQRPLAECHEKLSPLCLLRYYPSGCGGLNPLRMLRLYRRARGLQSILPFYARLMVVSQRMVDEFVREGFPPDKIDLLPYFPSGFKSLPEEPKLRPFSYRLLYFGRLVHLKGWQDAITAIQLASKKYNIEIELHMAGTGPDLQKVREIASHSKGKIQVHGNLLKSQSKELLTQMDAVLVPSRWAEPFGKVGLEAASKGVPAIAYDVGGISEWLKNGHTGLLLKSGVTNPEALAEKIGELYSNHDASQQMRVNAWRFAIPLTIDNHMRSFFASVEKGMSDFKSRYPATQTS